MASIDDFKNKHDSEQVFFIGNGPSLNETPLDSLCNEVTFATNKINLVYSHTDWRPSYYTYIHSESAFSEREKEMIVQNANNGTICFVSSHFRKLLPNHQNIVYLDTKIHKDNRIECLNNMGPSDRHYELWSDNLENHIYFYNNSVYPIYQIMNYMGVSDIFLVGCDLGMDTDWYPIFDDVLEPKMFEYKSGEELTIKKYIDGVFRYNDAPMGMLKSLTNGLAYKYPTLFEMILGDNVHFHEGYDKRAVVRRGTDGAQIRTHKLGKNILNKRGVKIYNATAGGELEVHPRVDLDEIC